MVEFSSRDSFDAGGLCGTLGEMIEFSRVMVRVMAGNAFFTGLLKGLKDLLNRGKQIWWENLD